MYSERRVSIAQDRWEPFEAWQYQNLHEQSTAGAFTTQRARTKRKNHPATHRLWQQITNLDVTKLWCP